MLNEDSTIYIAEDLITAGKATLRPSTHPVETHTIETQSIETQPLDISYWHTLLTNPIDNNHIVYPTSSSLS